MQRVDERGALRGLARGVEGLAPTPYADVSSWAFGDFVFSWDYDMFADTSKARRHGFHTFVDTEEMLRGQFEDLRRRRIIAS